MLRAVLKLGIFALAAALVAAPAEARTPLRITRISGPIATNATSQIYSPAVLPGTPEGDALAAAGYVQEEYFISGAANVYASGEHGPRVIRSGVRYTTRLLVLRPADPHRFSGNVQLTMYHPSFSLNMWARDNAYAVRHGDVWVAIGIGGDQRSHTGSTPDAPIPAPLVTKWFDPVRYAPLSWPDDEDGIRWDVFADTAYMLKHAQGPVHGYAVQRVYASGWSFLGSFLRTFLNEGFDAQLERRNHGPAIDGYLIGISSSSQEPGYLPINSHTPNRAVDNPARVLRPAGVPVIELISQNEGDNNIGPQAPDSDAYVGGHRLYELGGVSHGDTGYRTPSPYNVQLLARHHPGARPPAACGFEDTDVPMRDVAQAALANLDHWARESAAPPPSARLALDPATHAQLVDANGLPRGGVRVAQLDLPLARYGAAPDGSCAPPNAPYLIMKRLPLDAATLGRLYPGRAADYLARFNARLDALVRERYLLAEDADIERQAARERAAAAFH